MVFATNIPNAMKFSDNSYFASTINKNAEVCETKIIHESESVKTALKCAETLNRDTNSKVREEKKACENQSGDATLKNAKTFNKDIKLACKMNLRALVISHTAPIKRENRFSHLESYLSNINVCNKDGTYRKIYTDKVKHVRHKTCILYKKSKISGRHNLLRQ